MNETSHNDRPSGLVDLPMRVKLKDGRECVIRTMTEDDATQLCEILPRTHAESDCLNYLPGEFDKTVEQERTFIREHNAKPRSLSMVVEVDGRIVAYGGAAGDQRRRFHHHAEFGLCVVQAFWRQGLGRVLTEYAVEWGRRLGLRKLYLKVFADNTKAIALYRSAGFIEEARLPGDYQRADGTYGDTIIMAKVYADWTGMRTTPGRQTP